jgi:uncharacterized protein YjbJ (UPF0337 family)
MTTTTSTQVGTDEQSPSATDEGRRVAGVAKEEAGNVAAETKDQLFGVMDEARTQVSEQSAVQRDRLVQTLTTLSDDLEHMAQQSDRSGLATDLAHQVARRARDLGNRLDGREPEHILEDVRSFARRRPGAFLMGALAAGVVAGRLTRGARKTQGSTGSPSGTPATVTSPTPTPSTPAEPAAVDAVVVVDQPPDAPVGDAVQGTLGGHDPVGGDVPHDRGSL